MSHGANLHAFWPGATRPLWDCRGCGHSGNFCNRPKCKGCGAKSHNAAFELAQKNAKSAKAGDDRRPKPPGAKPPKKEVKDAVAKWEARAKAAEAKAAKLEATLAEAQEPDKNEEAGKSEEDDIGEQISQMESLLAHSKKIKGCEEYATGLKSSIDDLKAKRLAGKSSTSLAQDQLQEVGAEEECFGQGQ